MILNWPVKYLVLFLAVELYSHKPEFKWTCLRTPLLSSLRDYCLCSSNSIIPPWCHEVGSTHVCYYFCLLCTVLQAQPAASSLISLCYVSTGVLKPSNPALWRQMRIGRFRHERTRRRPQTKQEGREVSRLSPCISPPPLDAGPPRGRKPPLLLMQFTMAWQPSCFRRLCIYAQQSSDIINIYLKPRPNRNSLYCKVSFTEYRSLFFSSILSPMNTSSGHMAAHVRLSSAGPYLYAVRYFPWAMAPPSLWNTRASLSCSNSSRRRLTTLCCTRRFNIRMLTLNINPGFSCMQQMSSSSSCTHTHTRSVPPGSHIFTKSRTWATCGNSVTGLSGPCFSSSSSRVGGLSVFLHQNLIFFTTATCLINEWRNASTDESDTKAGNFESEASFHNVVWCHL